MNNITVSEQLRQALRESGKSTHAISKECMGAVDPRVIQRFLKGEREITSGTMDTLCTMLRLKLTYRFLMGLQEDLEAKKIAQ